jgi:transcriptional regulator with XRE-family HTH domain
MSADETSLGATLRAWRDRLSPAAAGLPSGRVRRAAGLRREELAELAGVSVDYVVRLEQGRATTPSAQVVSALARALRLSGPERDHLYRLAGLQPPRDGMITDHIPPGMQRVLTRLGETPAAVFAADWRLIWWNRSWAAVLGDPSMIAPEDRNLVKSRFPVAPVRPAYLTDREIVSDNMAASNRAVVADLRRASGRYPGDPRLAALIRRTLAGNERFAALWQDGAVGGHAEDHKTIRHPEVGDIHVDCDVLSDSDTDLKIVIFTAVPGSEDTTKLDLARVAGTSAPLATTAPPAGSTAPLP